MAGACFVVDQGAGRAGWTSAGQGGFPATRPRFLGEERLPLTTHPPSTKVQRGGFGMHAS